MSALDVYQAKTQTAEESARAESAARYAGQVAQDIDALNLLVGAPVVPGGELLPAGFERDATGLDDHCPPACLRRCCCADQDVLQAEHTLRAANANIGAARAAFFPTMILDRRDRHRQHRTVVAVRCRHERLELYPRRSACRSSRADACARAWGVAQADRDIALAFYERWISRVSARSRMRSQR